MIKSKSPSFVVTLPLLTNACQEKSLRSRFNAASHIYNNLLRESLKRLHKIRNSNQFQSAISLYKTNKLEARKQLKKLNENFEFTEFGIMKYSQKFTQAFKNVGSQISQQLAKRAFNAAFQYSIKKRGKPRFRKIHSIQNADNNCNIRFKDNSLLWGNPKKSGLKITTIIDLDDPCTQHAFKHKIKFLRVLKRNIKGKTQYYLQLILQGKPLQRFKQGNDQARQETVGMDEEL